MEQASRLIEGHPGKYSKTAVAEQIGGKTAVAKLAVEVLDDEEYVKAEPGSSGYKVYFPIKPYRQADDPQSDVYAREA